MEGLFHLYFTFPSTPSKIHPPQKKKYQKDCLFFFERFCNNKNVIVIVNISSSYIFSYPTLLVISDVFCNKNLHKLC